MIGRLRAGVSPLRAQQELTGLSLALQAEHPEGYLGPFGVAWSVIVEPAGAAPPDESLLASMLLVGAGLLGLAAVAAAAGLVRRRTAMAWALPVGIGGGIGWAVALLGSYLLASDGSTPDAGGVTALAVGVTATAIVASLLAGRLGARRRPGRPRPALGVMLCMASSVVLLASGIAVGRAYRAVVTHGPGIDPAGLLALRPLSGPLDADAIARVARMPDVEGVAVTSQVPALESAPAGTFEIEGHAAGIGPAPSATIQVVDAGYFAVARVPLVEGRTFASTSAARRPIEVVVNRTLAARFFPDGVALGQRLVVSLEPGRPSGWVTVVGIAADVRRGGPDRRPVAEIYLPPGAAAMGTSALLVRAPSATASTLAELGRLGPIVPLDRVVRERLASFRRTAWLLLLCALVMSLVTVISCFGASRASLSRAALCGAVLGGGAVLIASSGLARLPMLTPAGVGSGRCNRRRGAAPHAAGDAAATWLAAGSKTALGLGLLESGFPGANFVVARNRGVEIPRRFGDQRILLLLGRLCRLAGAARKDDGRHDGHDVSWFSRHSRSR